MRKGLIIIFLSLSFIGIAQNFNTTGYVKLLGNFTHVNSDYIPRGFESFLPQTSEDYQIHNRFNFKWYLGEKWTAAAGMRNQLFWGYQARNIPNYGQLLEDPGFLNLSTYWSNDKSYLRVFFDRLYIQYQNDHWKVRVGRQRINWGVNTTFNPNDLFNQYNYFDFDYEERPGVDALLVERYLGSSASIQLAATPGPDTVTQSVGAMLVKWNKWNADMQFLAGYYRHDIALGAGWASNFLWGSGWKGEFTQFIPLDPSFTEANFTLSTSIDYSFKNSVYMMLAWLYNDNGTLSPTILEQIQVTTTELTAKNIFPYKHTFMVSFQLPVTPLLSASLAWLQTPDFSNSFAIPQLTYSITQDLDFLILAQVFFANNTLQNEEWGYFSNLLFLRLKYSF